MIKVMLTGRILPRRSPIPSILFVRNDTSRNADELYSLFGTSGCGDFVDLDSSFYAPIGPPAD
jgi:hypothetical protein